MRDGRDGQGGLSGRFRRSPSRPELRASHTLRHFGGAACGTSSRSRPAPSPRSHSGAHRAFSPSGTPSSVGARRPHCRTRRVAPLSSSLKAVSASQHGRRLATSRGREDATTGATTGAATPSRHPPPGLCTTFTQHLSLNPGGPSAAWVPRRQAKGSRVVPDDKRPAGDRGPPPQSWARAVRRPDLQPLPEEPPQHSWEAHAPHSPHAWRRRSAAGSARPFTALS